jgi:hypothetical protein
MAEVLLPFDRGTFTPHIEPSAGRVWTEGAVSTTSGLRVKSIPG